MKTGDKYNNSGVGRGLSTEGGTSEGGQMRQREVTQGEGGERAVKRAKVEKEEVISIKEGSKVVISGTEVIVIPNRGVRKRRGV